MAVMTSASDSVENAAKDAPGRMTEYDGSGALAVLVLTRLTLSVNNRLKQSMLVAELGATLRVSGHALCQKLGG